MAFAAKYPGRCVSCADTITVGEQIKKSGRKYAHVDCSASEPRELSHKERFGRCEDAPCCGCCGGMYGLSY